MSERSTRPVRRLLSEDWQNALSDRLCRALAASIDTRGNVIPAAILSLLIVTVSCLISWRLGLPQMSIYGHDIFTMLDGSWRVLQGQIPHVDFYSAFGPVFYFVQAVGLSMSNYRVDGLVLSTALAGVLLGVWSFAIMRNRLSGMATVLGVAFVAFFWLAPFPIGEPYYMPSYAMQYNRLGYVLLFIIVVELFSSINKNLSRLDWGRFSTGIALASLLFMKANFFVMGAALVAGAYLIRVKKRRHAAFLVAGWLIVFGAIMVYFHGHLLPFWHDLRTAAGARQTRFDEIKDSIRTPIRNAATIVPILGLAVFAMLRRREPLTESLPCLKQPAFIALLILGADFILSLSNQQRFGFPLTDVAIILFIDQICRVEVKDRTDAYLGTVPALLLVLIATVLPGIMNTVNAWAIEVTMRKNTVISIAARVDAVPLADMVFDDHVDPVWGQSEANGHLLTTHVNDGLTLLRQNSGPRDRIACLCYANPFTYELLRPPIEGGRRLLRLRHQLYRTIPSHCRAYFG